MPHCGANLHHGVAGCAAGAAAHATAPTSSVRTLSVVCPSGPVANLMKAQAAGGCPVWAPAAKGPQTPRAAAPGYPAGQVGHLSVAGVVLEGLAQVEQVADVQQHGVAAPGQQLAAAAPDRRRPEVGRGGDDPLPEAVVGQGPQL